ncbi:MAG TPA: hypothetical protein VGR12_04085 [Solirubrobacteraceae bacterium]|nr:hypothetical protein [Solirubrobacteraceae bacterium]
MVPRTRGMLDVHSPATRRATTDWWLILVIPSMTAAYATLSLSSGVVSDLIEEDGVYEWVGTLGLFAAAIAFAVAAVRTRRFVNAGGGDASRWKPWVFAALAAGLFFAAGEEISWGQRLLGIETPESLRAANGQDEINVHNLAVVGGRLDMLFQLFWAGLFVVIPLVAEASSRARRALRRFLPVAPPVIAVLLIANYLLAQTSERVLDGELYDSIYPLTHSVNELKEAVVGLVLGIAALLILRRTEQRAAEPA